MPIVSASDVLRSYLHTLSRRELQWLQRSLTCQVDGPKNRRVTLIAGLVRHAESMGLSRDYIRALVQHGEILGFPGAVRHDTLVGARDA